MRVLIPFLLFISVSCVHRDASFTHDVSTPQKPWTHEAFKNDPAEFQFAILSDRTGGMREGIFDSAVTKMNSIQPEFVISVGDYIQGYTRDRAEIDAQWQEMDQLTSWFEMPFFFLPGNHDITNPEMQSVYEDRFGSRYYAFVYKDVLFMCLDTQDKPVRMGQHIQDDAGLLPEQIAWAQGVLAEHPDVRWTFVLMHQPLWLYEEWSTLPDARDASAGRTTGWRDVVAALGDRPYTVIAGHLHRYTKYVRHDHNYYVLATTGGASELRGTAYGQFDHAVWVTMTHDGPMLANLVLEGIQGDDVYTERTAAFRESLQMDYTVDESLSRITGTLTVSNNFQHPLNLSRAWTATSGDGWRLHSSLETDRLLPGEKKVHTIALAVDPGAGLADLPHLDLGCVAGSELNGVYELPSPLRPYLAARRPRLAVRRLDPAPVIDGVIGDEEWASAAAIVALEQLEHPVPSEDPAAVRCAYDDEYLYLAGRFVQDPTQLRVNFTRSDQSLWEDDSIELFFDANRDEKTYAKAIVTAANVTLLDNLAAIESAVGRTDDAWTVEARIPWTALGHSPPARGDRFGFNLRRNRSLPEGRRASEWTSTLVATPFALDLFGIVELD